MLPWKLRKCQILPVNQNLSSVYFSYAKFQLVSCDPSLAIIWQMTYTHKLPKLCSATLSSAVEKGYEDPTILGKLGEALDLKGTPPCQRKAFEMYNRAGKLGSTNSQINLAEMYRCGVRSCERKHRRRF